MKSINITRKKGVLFLLGIFFCMAAIYLMIVRLKFIEYSSGDLYQDYFAAKHLLNHESIYSDITHPNYHPPLAAFLVAPLILLPYWYACLLWSIITVFLYFTSGWFVFKELDIRIPYYYMMVIIGYSLCWYPFQANIALGQWSILIGTCMVIGWISLRHQKDFLAGVVLGLSCLIKLYPGLIIIYLLLTKRWKALVTMISVVLVGFLIMGIILGPREIIYYFTTIVPRDVNAFIAFPGNYSILGILEIFFSDGAWVRPIFISPIPINLLTLVLDIGVFIILVRLMLHLPINKDNNDIKYALTIITMFFISPLSWQHMLTILILPIGILLMKIPSQVMKYKYGYSLALFVIVLLSIPDIEVGLLLIRFYYPNRIPWFSGLLFLAYDISLLILGILLLRSRRTEFEEFANNSTRQEILYP